MKSAIEKIKSDPRYQRNIEYGEPRPGHPEGKIKVHIAELEENLELIDQKKSLQPEDYWKLKFMIHVHDTFKEEAEKGSTPHQKISHAILAREYASQYTEDPDLLNMIQYHDENYKMWKEYSQTGRYDETRLQKLISTIVDWDLFLVFIIIDGCIKGKEQAKLSWFINEVKKYKENSVDVSWLLPE